MHVSQVAEPEFSPRYFEAGARSLFGIYHAPQAAVARDVGVLLCHPGPHEYNQLHWGMRKLAVMLSRAGAHVLRFDYSGTGDSSGDTADASLAEWTEDVVGAADELKALSGLRRLSLVGLRLGGSLAMRANASGVRVRDLVLWDPVVSGADYVRDLELLESRRLASLIYPQSNHRERDELMGVSFTARQRAEYLAVDLLAEPVGRHEKAFVVAPVLSTAHARLTDRLRELGATASAAQVDDPHLLEPVSYPTEAVLSHNVPMAIVRHLTGGAA